jgi:Zn-dependent M28 family amino/carboxypeptidase
MAKNQAELLNLPDLSEIDNIELVSLIGQKTNTKRFAILTQILNEWMIDYKIQILYLEPVKEANIIIPSVDKNEKIVLAAHYDVFPESYGYIDNACAVACLILLKKRGMLPDNVEILLCDCEECGQYGSSRYCEMYHEQIKAVINLDVIGYGEVLYYMHNNPIFESIATKHSMKPANFPPCDYDSFKNLNMPTLSLSTGDGPDWDTTYPKLISLLHNNRNDNDINMVNSDSMTLVINTLEQILQNGTLNKLKTTAR